MRFWTRWAAILVALPLLATAASAQSVAPTAPGPERLALAGEMLDAVQPPGINAVGARMAGQVLQQIFVATVGYSGGAPAFDEAQLHRSLTAGAAVGVEQSRAVFVESYAREMTDDEMRAVIAFYTSEEGRAGLEATTRYLDRYMTLLETGDQQQLQQMAPYEPPAASVAFNDSAAGQALARAEASDALKGAGLALMQNQIAAAQADYCAHAVCEEDHIGTFQRMSLLITPDPSAPER